MKILITGTAGFIGFHLAGRLLNEGHTVFGYDNFNDYYSVALKHDRHARLEQEKNYQWQKADLCDLNALQSVFRAFQPECVVNLAAQVGVRYASAHPRIYQKSNIEGFLHILECCRYASCKPRLIYASSSSVYGGNTVLPFSEDQRVDTPISFYAASKKANELMAHCYSHLYGIQTIGLRFFTVYGPWGRPDMAYWLFTDALSKGEPIQVFNNGEMYRDFTYIDDIVAGIHGCVVARKLPSCDIFNIGNHRSEKLMELIALIACELGVDKPKLKMLPMQNGDMRATYASVEKLRAAVGYEPATPLSVGIPRFIQWFKEHGNKY